jgi:hypothetical protein
MGKIGRKKKGANKATYDYKKIRDDSLESSIILDSDEDNNISSDISFTSSEIDTDIDAIDGQMLNQTRKAKMFDEHMSQLIDIII